MKSYFTKQKLNRVFYFLMAVLLGVCVREGTKHDLDFQVLYKVGQQFLAGDYDFYVIVPYPGWPYRYGPIFPVLMAPFALLAKPQAQLIWAILNALIIPVAWFFTERVLVRRVGEIVRAPLARILTLFLVVDYITRNAGLGNINMLMYLSLIWGVDLSDQRKHFWSGFVVALSAAVKVYSGAAALYFLCTRKWREFFWSAGLTLFFTFGAPAIIYGPGTMIELIRKWLMMLQDRSTYPFFKYINQSPFAVFWRMTGNELLTKSLNASFILVAFLFLAYLSRRYWKSNNQKSSEATKTDLMILLVSISIPLFVLACVYTEYHLIALPIILVANAFLFQEYFSKTSLVIYWIRFAFVHLAVLEIAGRALTEKIGAYGNHLFGVVALLLIINLSLKRLKSEPLR